MPINRTPISGEKEGSAPKPQKTNDEKEITFTLSDPLFCLDDLIVSDKTFEELSSVINSRKNWDKVFVQWNMQSILKQRKNLFINLYGESGTGKTMAAHAIIKELGQKFINVSYADIESKYVGETSKNLMQLFKYAGETGCVILFDEADALLSKRVTNMNSSTDVSVNQTRSVMLTLLNDFDGMVIFTTNFISNYDEAFMRRIQYHIRFDLPNEELRKKIWERYIPSRMPTDADTAVLASDFSDISGGDIANAVMKAALKAANDDLKLVPQDYFRQAVTDIRESRLANDDVTITKREISEEEAMQQLEGNGKVRLDKGSE